MIGMRVLLAEDGLDNQRLIELLLRKAGADAVIADHGKAAVEAIDRAEADGRPFDVVLMDMQMPEMDGYQATALLRRNGYCRPIIALTANALEGDRERCFVAGCDEFVAKPIDKQRLFDAIVRATRRARLLSEIAPK